ncbi:hypothetical protein [Paenibacillus sp. MMO-177]
MVVTYEAMIEQRDLIQRATELFGQNMQSLAPDGQSIDQVF